MSTLLTLEFEGLPPTVNSMYRNVGSRRYKQPEVQDWQEEISSLMAEEWNKVEKNSPVPHERPPYRRQVAAEIELTSKDRRGWDIDNRLKSLLDCLELAGVLVNDSQIDSLKVTRNYGEGNKTRIILMEYKQDGYDDRP